MDFARHISPQGTFPSTSLLYLSACAKHVKKKDRMQVHTIPFFQVVTSVELSGTPFCICIGLFMMQISGMKSGYFHLLFEVFCMLGDLLQRRRASWVLFKF
jgi:hypothetical protein